VDTFIKLRPENFLKSRDHIDKSKPQQLNIRTLGDWVELFFSGHKYEDRIWNEIAASITECCDDEIRDDETVDQFVRRHAETLSLQQLADVFNNAQSHAIFCIECDINRIERQRERRLLEK